MFTGIVTGIGTVRKAVIGPGGLELTIESPYRDLEPGESVAVDGACLTVEVAAPDAFSVHVIRTTLDRTRFGRYASGQRVNLERALQAGDRLGGHLVQAHVDGVGKVERLTQRGEARLLDLRVPDQVARVTVVLGSITVDGVSLTVNAKPSLDVIQISLIPFTLQHTTLGERVAGDEVHLEADTIGKYVAALLEERKR
ncbi:MAG: riboflavin synthase [Gemmatimonadales bacterium]